MGSRRGCSSGASSRPSCTFEPPVRHFEISTPFTSSQTGKASSAAPAATSSGHMDVARGGHKKVIHATPPAIHHQPTHLGRNVDCRMRKPVTSSKQAKSTKEI